MRLEAGGKGTDPCGCWKVCGDSVFCCNAKSRKYSITSMNDLANLPTVKCKGESTTKKKKKKGIFLVFRKNL